MAEKTIGELVFTNRDSNPEVYDHIVKLYNQAEDITYMLDSPYGVAAKSDDIKHTLESLGRKLNFR